MYKLRSSVCLLEFCETLLYLLWSGLFIFWRPPSKCIPTGSSTNETCDIWECIFLRMELERFTFLAPYFIGDRHRVRFVFMPFYCTWGMWLVADLQPSKMAPQCHRPFVWHWNIANKCVINFWSVFLLCTCFMEQMCKVFFCSETCISPAYVMSLSLKLYFPLCWG